jgi:UV DNA damage endonuclease
MDLMIEAKDKEQAVFELMRAFKLPGFEKFSNLIPHVRTDETKAGATGKVERHVPDEENRGMGGSEGRVYWPPGMEEWLKPKKREPKVKGDGIKAAKTGRGKRKSDVAQEVKELPLEEPAVPKRAPRRRQAKTVDYVESGQSE